LRFNEELGKRSISPSRGIAGIHREHFQTKESEEMKPRFVIVALVILALALPASMLAQQNSKEEKEVRAVLDQITAANLKGGDEAAAAFDKLFADDYTRITSDGAVHNKADMLNGFRTGKTKIETLELSDIKIRIYGHTAVVTGNTNSKGVLVGANIPQRTRFTRILVKRDGKWESVLYQNTRIAP
jgi:hypothetical protein